jgi:hypothetical protein
MTQPGSEGVLLTVTFPRPGFFINDARVTVELNGQQWFDGSFLNGFEGSTAVQPGNHVLDLAIEFGPLRRKRRYTIPVPPARGLTVALAYSRLWGNFTKKPLLTPY